MIAQNDATLPILSHVDEIVSTVNNNQVTIIVGQTSSGKSTQTPQILRKAGYKKILMTLPRRFTAKCLARRLAEEMQVELGDVVGYRLGNTGNANHDRLCHAGTEVLLTTNALFLDHVLESDDSETLYIIDELHEWGLDIEVAIGVLKKKLAENPHLKIVLMSATIEAEELSKFFDNAPIINVEGRTYPVEVRTARGNELESTLTLFREGRDVLVFLDGEREITEMIQSLKDLEIDAELIPLHSKISPEEQDLALKSYTRQKIVVATNIAESSLTIPGINGVVDSGKKKIKVVENGVDSLKSVLISKAESEQRKGRAGRCEPGVYINCADGPQDDFPVPEILRLRLDKTVLQLLERGIELEDLTLMHQPPRNEIIAAKRVLELLNCIDKYHNVTEVGSQVAKLPLGVHTGRMIVEAIKRDVLADVITIVSILENESFFHRESTRWWQLTDQETGSELLAALNAFKNLKDVREKEKFKDVGIILSNLLRVKECRSRLFEHLKNEHYISSSGDREEILHCITAGMLDRVFIKTYSGLTGQDGFSRLPNKSGIVRAMSGEFIVGVPRDISYKDKRYGFDRVLPIVTYMSKVSFEMIAAHAVDLKKLDFDVDDDGYLAYDMVNDAVMLSSTISFQGHEICTYASQVSTTPEAQYEFRCTLARMLSGESEAPECLKDIVQKIQDRNQRCALIQKERPSFTYRTWDYFFFESWLIEKVEGLTSLRQIKDLNSLLPVESLDSKVKDHLQSFPEEILVEGIGKMKIDYSAGMPTITIDSDDWKKLPDECLKLPNGSRIAVNVWIGGEQVATLEMNYRNAKFRASDVIIRELENIFKEQKGIIEQYDLSTLVVSYPKVRTEVYAHHPTMGHPMELYGVLTCAGGDLFGWKWFFDPTTAEEKHAEEVSLVRTSYFDSLTRVSFARMRDGTRNLSDAWIFRENGSPRAADSRDKGMLVWNSLSPSELVLAWTCEDKAAPESQKFFVIQYPITELTESQTAAVARVEKDMKCPIGSFLRSSLDLGMLETLSKAFSKCPLSDEKVMWVKSDLLRLSSDSGKILGSGPAVQEFGMSYMSTTSAYGCPASVIEEQVINGITFELLTFELDTVWKLAIRVKR